MLARLVCLSLNYVARSIHNNKIVLLYLPVASCLGFLLGSFYATLHVPHSCIIITSCITCMQLVKRFPKALVSPRIALNVTALYSDRFSRYPNIIAAFLMSSSIDSTDGTSSASPASAAESTPKISPLKPMFDRLDLMHTPASISYGLAFKPRYCTPWCLL